MKYLLGRIASSQRWVVLPRRTFHASAMAEAQRKVTKTFKLADIGEGITECEVLKWSVKAPTKVEHFDVLCEVQSDKATVEITSPFDGTVTKVLVGEGEIAKVGQGLCEMEVLEDEEHDAGEVKKAEEVEPTPTSTPPPPAKKVDEAATVAPAPASTTRVRRPHPLDPNQPQPSSQISTPNLSFTSSNHNEAEAERKTLATPSVRHFARSQGIPRLSALFPGSGKNGRIEKADVEKWMSGAKEEKTATKGDVAATSAQQTPAGEEMTIELGRTRWAMWKAMEQSLKIPHFGYSTTLDLTNLASILPSINAHIPAEYNPPKPSQYLPAVSPHSIYGGQQPPTTQSDPSTHYTKMTYLPLLIKSLARAMQEWPLFRSSISLGVEGGGSKPNLVVRPHADIAVALSTPSGLFTPVVQRADTKSAYAIMGELRSLAAKGRAVPHKLSVEDMPKRGATITVSNVGAIGAGESAHPLLVPGGGVAIVAIGRAKEVWDHKAGKERLQVGVSWSADHRVVEGAEMAAFVETWRKWVESPGVWAADGR